MKTRLLFSVIFFTMSALFMTKTIYAAPQKLVLKFGGKTFIKNNIIPLKKLIKQNYPYTNLHNKDLLRVVLLAKSKFGKGTAKLVIGSKESSPVFLNGYPSKFFVNQKNTYDKVTIENPSYDSFGKWQILLRGNIRVLKIKVFLINTYLTPAINFNTIAKFKSPKVILGYNNIFVGKAKIKELRIKITENSVYIKSVRVFFGNGTSRTLFSLSGNFYDGQIKTTSFNFPDGRFIERIQISSTTTNFIGSRARIKVLIGQVY